MVNQNPFRPGAGQTPLFLAGRESEQRSFAKLLEQNPVMQNVIISGLRGVGKTVLLETLKPVAHRAGWLWTGNDLSESASLNEERICKRLVTDLSILLQPIILRRKEQIPLGFNTEIVKANVPLSFNDLWRIFGNAPGLNEDKIKEVLRNVRQSLEGSDVKGIVFAYDEAQNLGDKAKAGEYPLSIILDTFASLQRDRHAVQFLLVLTGLPTLFPKLNEARTYTERMFTVLQLDRLSDEASVQAIRQPIEISQSTLTFSEITVESIKMMSGGYPYFIQYICKEIFDSWIIKMERGEVASAASNEIMSKLDQDFFIARWDRATDRQQEFMTVIAALTNGDEEFTIQEIVERSKVQLEKGFSPSHATQILNGLIEKGLIYRTKHGKYRFAVPLMSGFISRNIDQLNN